ncbi:MAG: DUF3368 domain-containing protein [Candidatus Hydrothermarchaeales archaeon]
MIVSDSTPLIYLAKIGRLHLLREFFDEVYIPDEVFKESVERGREEKYTDAIVIEEAVKGGWVKIQRVGKIEKLKEFGIDEGEAETISLALALGSREVLLDQGHARLAAQVMGLRPRGTIFVLLKALVNEIITYDDYLKDLECLVKAGFRMSDEVYLEAVRLGREASD